MSKSTAITREMLLALALRRETVNVPDLGGEITIQEFTTAQAAAFQAMSTEAMDGKQVRSADALARLSAQVLVWGVVNEQGSALFADEDIPTIMALPNRMVDRVASAILDLSGQGPQSLVEAKKNSDGTGGDGSSSA